MLRCMCSWLKSMIISVRFFFSHSRHLPHSHIHTFLSTQNFRLSFTSQRYSFNIQYQTNEETFRRKKRIYLWMYAEKNGQIFTLRKKVFKFSLPFSCAASRIVLIQLCSLSSCQLVGRADSNTRQLCTYTNVDGVSFLWLLQHLWVNNNNRKA